MVGFWVLRCPGGGRYFHGVNLRVRLEGRKVKRQSRENLEKIDSRCRRWQGKKETRGRNLTTG